MGILEDISERREAAVSRVRLHGHILNLGWLVCSAAFLMLGQAGFGVGQVAPTFAAIALWAVGQAVLILGFRHLRLQVVGWENLAAKNAELQDSMQRVSSWASSTETAVKTKSEFLAGMSHELRAPLASIIGMTDVILETDLTPDQRDFLRIIVTSGNSLLSIINDVLDYSRMEAGHVELEDIEFSLNEVIDCVGEIIAPRAAEQSIELICDVDPTIPENLCGDPQRLQQILINLAANAVKFTHDGEVRIEATLIKRTNTSADIRCRVVDTGIGIAPDRCEAVFGSYTQASDDISRCYGGTGLGLFISRRLAELMGGGLSVDSTIGHGSIFDLSLTLKIAASCNHVVAPDHLGDRRLLVIDHNASSRRSLRRILNDLGCRPDEADCGRQALALLHQAATAGDPFDLVLLGLDLPGTSSPEILQKIRTNPALRSVPVILLSPINALGHLAGQIDPDWNSYIVKPVKRDSLISQLARALVSKPAAAPRVTPPSQGDRKPASNRGETTSRPDATPVV